MTDPSLEFEAKLNAFQADCLPRLLQRPGVDRPDDAWLEPFASHPARAAYEAAAITISALAQLGPERASRWLLSDRKAQQALAGLFFCCAEHAAAAALVEGSGAAALRKEHLLEPGAAEAELTLEAFLTCYWLLAGWVAAISLLLADRTAWDEGSLRSAASTRDVALSELLSLQTAQSSLALGDRLARHSAPAWAQEAMLAAVSRLDVLLARVPAGDEEMPSSRAAAERDVAPLMGRSGLATLGDVLSTLGTCRTSWVLVGGGVVEADERQQLTSCLYGTMSQCSRAYVLLKRAGLTGTRWVKEWLCETCTQLFLLIKALTYSTVVMLDRAPAAVVRAGAPVLERVAWAVLGGVLSGGPRRPRSIPTLATLAPLYSHLLGCMAAAGAAVGTGLWFSSGPGPLLAGLPVHTKLRVSGEVLFAPLCWGRALAALSLGGGGLPPLPGLLAVDLLPPALKAFAVLYATELGLSLCVPEALVPCERDYLNRLLPIYSGLHHARSSSGAVWREWWREVEQLSAMNFESEAAYERERQTKRLERKAQEAEEAAKRAAKKKAKREAKRTRQAGGGEGAGPSDLAEPAGGAAADAPPDPAGQEGEEGEEGTCLEAAPVEEAASGAGPAGGQGEGRAEEGEEERRLREAEEQMAALLRQEEEAAAAAAEQAARRAAKRKAKKQQRRQQQQGSAHGSEAGEDPADQPAPAAVAAPADATEAEAQEAGPSSSRAGGAAQHAQQDEQATAGPSASPAAPTDAGSELSSGRPDAAAGPAQAPEPPGAAAELSGGGSSSSRASPSLEGGQAAQQSRKGSRPTPTESAGGLPEFFPQPAGAGPQAGAASPPVDQPLPVDLPRRQQQQQAAQQPAPSGRQQRGQQEQGQQQAARQQALAGRQQRGQQEQGQQQAARQQAPAGRQQQGQQEQGQQRAAQQQAPPRRQRQGQQQQQQLAQQPAGAGGSSGAGPGRLQAPSTRSVPVPHPPPAPVQQPRFGGLQNAAAAARAPPAAAVAAAAAPAQGRAAGASTPGAGRSPGLPPALGPAPPPSAQAFPTPQSLGGSRHSVSECVLCLDAPPDCVLLPCRHLALCTPCGEGLWAAAAHRAGPMPCPVCRAEVGQLFPVYLP